MNLIFVQFSTKYKIDNGKLTKLPDNVVPRIFPTYSSNPKGQNFPKYCKYQLLRYKPWKHTQNDAWGNQEPCDEVFVSQWQEFLQTAYAHWFDKLETVIQSQNETENCILQQDTVDHEEWMIISDLDTPFENFEGL